MPARASAKVSSFDLDEDIVPSIEEANTSKIESQIREMFISADQIQFGTDVEELRQIVDLPESEQRYSLEKQTGDLLDELLSTIPNIKRTDAVLNNINTMIERFKQLRKKYSIFDKNGNLVSALIKGDNYKPLIETLQTFNHKLYWLLPVVKNIKKIYDYDDSGEDIGDHNDLLPLTLADVRKEEEDIVDQYNSGNVPEQDNKYAYLLKAFKPYLTPFENNFQRDDEDENPLAIIKVNTNISAIVDNLGDFFSSVLESGKDISNIKRRRFVMQEYKMGLTGLDVKKFRGGESEITRKKITDNDVMVLKSLLILPGITVQFSRINMPCSSILLKANLNRHFLNYWQLLDNKTKIDVNTINNFNTSVYTNTTEIFKNITEMALDTTARAGVEKNKIYENYLNTVVPNTPFLFNLIKPYISENLSVYNVLNYLEPFMIYIEDVSILQYKEFNEYISTKIIDFKKMTSPKLRSIVNERGLSTETAKLKKSDLLKLLEVE